MKPNFPANTMDLIHGVRAFFPMLAAWFALLMIFARSNRVFPWIMGPLGLMLLYTVTGLVSSATLSPDPIYALYYGANYLAIVLVLLAIVLVEDPLPDLRKVLSLTWSVGTILTLSLLGAIPILGSQAIVQTETSPDWHARVRWGRRDHGNGFDSKHRICPVCGHLRTGGAPWAYEEGQACRSDHMGDIVRRFALRLDHCQWPYGNIGICRRRGRDLGCRKSQAFR